MHVIFVSQASEKHWMVPNENAPPLLCGHGFILFFYSTEDTLTVNSDLENDLVLDFSELVIFLPKNMQMSSVLTALFRVNISTAY